MFFLVANYLSLLLHPEAGSYAGIGLVHRVVDTLVLVDQRRENVAAVTLGRPTPFSSTTESDDVAEQFARPAGRVWQTSAALAGGLGAAHLSRKQLLQLLKGFGKGKAKWTQAWEVAQAAQYVEQSSEHLLDWSAVTAKDIAGAIAKSFHKRS